MLIPTPKLQSPVRSEKRVFPARRKAVTPDPTGWKSGRGSHRRFMDSQNPRGCDTDRFNGEDAWYGLDICKAVVTVCLWVSYIDGLEWNMKLCCPMAAKCFLNQAPQWRIVCMGPKQARVVGPCSSDLIIEEPCYICKTPSWSGHSSQSHRNLRVAPIESCRSLQGSGCATCIF